MASSVAAMRTSFTACASACAIFCSAPAERRAMASANRRRASAAEASASILRLPQYGFHFRFGGLTLVLRVGKKGLSLLAQLLCVAELLGDARRPLVEELGDHARRPEIEQQQDKQHEPDGYPGFGLVKTFHVPSWA